MADDDEKRTTFQQRRFTYLVALSISHLVCGALLIAFNAAAWGSGAPYGSNGAGIWVGGLFIVSGIVGITASSKENVLLVLAVCGMSLALSCLWVAPFSQAAGGIHATRTAPDPCGGGTVDAERQCNTRRQRLGLDAMLLLVSMLCGAAAVLSALHAALMLGCCRPLPTAMVAHWHFSIDDEKENYRGSPNRVQNRDRVPEHSV